MSTKIELQNRIDSTIAKLYESDETIVSNILKQYNCDSIADLKVMLEGYTIKKGLAGLAIAGTVAGATEIAVAHSINNPAMAFLGGASIGVGLNALIRLIMLIRAEKKVQQRLKAIKQSGNIKNVNEVNNKLTAIKSKISKKKVEIKHIVSKLPPEKKAKFLEKAKKIKAKLT